MNFALMVITLCLIGASIASTIALPRSHRGVFVYSALIMMTGIYVGFSIINIESDVPISLGIAKIVVLEGMIAIVLAAAGLAVLRTGYEWVLGALILVHGGIDGVHLLLGSSHVPSWYALLCVVYDGAFGSFAIWILSRQPESAKFRSE